MRAILAVSFGTSYEEAGKKNIERTEEELRENAGGARVYRAWTSKMIMQKVRERDGLSVDDVGSACRRMRADGIQDLIVQPMHIINGIENDQMIADVLSHRDEFSRISFGNPLLTKDSDYTYIVRHLGKLLQDYLSDHFQDKKTAVVLMGHGSEHHANSAYAALDYHFKDHALENFFVGTVEAYPDLNTVLSKVKCGGYERVLLTPFMLVAGDHAINDMAGDEEDSWKSAFLHEGIEPICLVKGLGEYQEIRNLFVQHMLEASYRITKIISL